jgi:outer membrane protein OmpA-like peptidoglycan-associated protein
MLMLSNPRPSFIGQMGRLSSVAGLLLAGACASVQPVPRELVDARDAYNRAVAGPGAELAPAQLHTAKQALDKAEQQFEDEPEAVETRDMAYIAQRKAQIAESQAGSELAKQQQTQASKSLGDTKDSLSAQTTEQLASAKEQLAKAQMQAREALIKLSGLKNSVKQEERGLVITLSGNVLFGSGKSMLLPAARHQLDEIAHALNDVKSQSIIVEGHTDATGSREINASLGHRRAKAVADYLVKKGIPSDKISAVGKGPDSPVAGNHTAEGRASNRRVEIVVQAESTTK